MVNDKKLKEIMKGKTKRLNGDEIIFIIEQFPEMKKSTYNKLIKAYNSGRGCNFSLSVDEMQGSGFMKSIGKVGKSLGKAAVKSGVSDILIDEGLKQTGLNPELSGKIGKLSKNVSRDLVGGSMNPYLPDALKGGSIGKPRAYSSLSNRVHTGSDSFMVNPNLLPTYDQYKAMSGRGFMVH